MEERDLKEYVVKLNDRNIQRQRESGFTLYATFGISIFCFLYLLENLDIGVIIITNPTNFIIATIISNIILSIFFLFLSYKTLTRNLRFTKIFPESKQFYFESQDILLFVGLLIIACFNFFAIDFSQSFLENAIFGFFGLISFLNIIVPFFYVEYFKSKIKKKTTENIEVENLSYSYLNYEKSKKLGVGIIIYALIFLTIIFSYCFYSKINVQIEDIKSVSKYTLMFFSFLYSINLAMNLNDNIKNNNLLEDFEKEIFFDNISNKEIAQKFEKDFSGIPFSRWIKQRQIEILDFFEIKRKEFLAQGLRFNDVQNTEKSDKSYNIKLDDIINTKKLMFNETKTFIEKNQNTFSDLNNLASLNEEENELLNFVIVFLNQNISSFNNSQLNLEKQIRNLRT